MRRILFVAALVLYGLAGICGICMSKGILAESFGVICFIVILAVGGVVCTLIAGVLLEPGPGLLPGIWEETGYGMTEEDLREIRELLDTLDEGIPEVTE